MIAPVISNLQKDIALLQLYIEQRKQTGFHDMERMIESLTIYMFRALKMGGTGKTMNQIKVNFPAIDLADNKNMIAVQVTTKATPAKIKKQSQPLKRNKSGKSLKDIYPFLYILGFVKAQNAQFQVIVK